MERGVTNLEGIPESSRRVLPLPQVSRLPTSGMNNPRQGLTTTARSLLPHGEAPNKGKFPAMEVVKNNLKLYADRESFSKNDSREPSCPATRET